MKSIEALELARKAKEALLSKKGEDVVVLDLRGLTSVADYYLLATANNTPHIKALVEETIRVLKDEGIRSYRRAGTPESEWIAVDYIEIVIHIFSPETRTYYELEELWKDAPRVEV